MPATVMVKLAEAVHPLASVTMAVYNPMERESGFTSIPVMSFQTTTYSGVPPDTVASAWPSPAPESSDTMVTSTSRASGSTTVNGVSLVHPWRSVATST